MEPVAFAREVAGECSFCGAAASEAEPQAGVAARPWRVCPRCLKFCGEMLDDTLADAPPDGPDSETPDDEDAPWEQTAARNAEHRAALGLSNEAGPAIEEMQRLIEATADSTDDATQQELLRFVTSPAAKLIAAERVCSFCDATRIAVKMILPGPRVYICNVCVEHAAAVVTASPAARERS